MLNIKNFLAYLLIIILINACNLFSFELIKLDISLSDDCEYFSDEYVEVNSNFDLDKKLFEEIVSIKKDNQSDEINFIWLDSKTLHVMPVNKWQKGCKYNLTIKGKCKTLSDGSFDVYESRNFYYGNEDDMFFLVSFPSDALISLDDAITFEFNKAVNQSSFIKNFNISPYSSYKTQFTEDGKSIVIFPEKQWDINTNYLWELPQEIISIDNYKLNKNYSGNITSVFDSELPELLNIFPVSLLEGTFLVLKEKELTEVTDNQSICFEFSKSMDILSVKNNISFTPAVKGYFLSLDDNNKSFIFTPYENYEIECDYKIIIEDTCKDLNGLELFKPYEYFFKSTNQYLKVVSISIDDILLSDYTEIESIGLTQSFIEVSIIFSQEIEDLYKAEQMISLSCIFPDYTGRPVKESCYWNNHHNQVTFIYSNIKSPGNYYEIKIAGSKNSIISSVNSYLKEDLCVIFVTN